ncbi:biotin-dependent carboxyltransferase family protein [Streptomyces sp. HNM0645]|uniref:5-oxoprolinase subunit C family protein n=1 Tax=Streptomyces sp. HNM0645 TaxID=2782343 RepID=UPI0024B66B9D|nr:biotin-dependent carboxyltransferase family protein [Streptomyces sp. HNM0645]MDI9889244.1 biotin-dependent carboxyltransferase family protein [Streptomyces sp. HNM0645]
MSGGKLEVLRAGTLTTIQDLGRFGHAGLGVPRSGALDRPAHRLANQLVGNPADAATLETTLTGVAVRTAQAAIVAVTGAPAPVRVNGRPAAWASPVYLPAGATLHVGTTTSGLRSYVAVSGGIAVPPVLASRSTDLLSGLGPAPLRDGDTLPVGEVTGSPLHTDTVVWQGPPQELVLPVLLGPRDDWFTTTALNTLATARFHVSSHSNRIALRTDGPTLERAVHDEMPSEGMVVGAVQVPPDGKPVVFLADCPTTGGYPVIGVVPENQLPAAAQAVPGLTVRFLPSRRRP